MVKYFFTIFCLIFAENSRFVESDFINTENSCKSHRLKKKKKLKKRKNKKSNMRISLSEKNP